MIIMIAIVIITSFYYENTKFPRLFDKFESNHFKEQVQDLYISTAIIYAM